MGIFGSTLKIRVLWTTGRNSFSAGGPKIRARIFVLLGRAHLPRRAQLLMFFFVLTRLKSVYDGTYETGSGLNLNTSEATNRRESSQRQDSSCSATSMSKYTHACRHFQTVRAPILQNFGLQRVARIQCWKLIILHCVVPNDVRVFFCLPALALRVNHPYGYGKNMFAKAAKTTNMDKKET